MSIADENDMVPQRRAGIRVQQNEDGRWVLIDDVINRRLPVDERGAQAIQLLDRPQTLAEFSQRLGSDVAAARRIIALFTRVQLLATADTDALMQDHKETQRIAAMDPADVPLIIDERARFGCTMCGSCCGGHNIGPVFDDTIDGLRDKLPGLRPKMRVDKGFFFEIATAPGQPDSVACHSHDGWCVFLSDDRRCLIHQEHGGDAKPRACQLFPYQFIATPAGVVVSLQPECRGFVEARQGPRLVDQQPELRHLLRKIPGLKSVRTAVAMGAQQVVPWAAYEAFESRLLTAIEENESDDIGALLAMRAALAGPLAGEDVVPTAALKQALAGLVTSMGHTTAALRQAFGQPSDTEVVHVDALDGLDAALTGLLPRFIRICRRLDRAPQRDLFVDFARNHLIGKQLTMAQTVRKGLARFAFSWLLAKSLAYARARAAKRRHLVPQDIQDGIVVISTLFRSQDFTAHFRQHDDAITALFFDQLPAVLQAADALQPIESRIEVHKF